MRIGAEVGIRARVVLPTLLVIGVAAAYANCFRGPFVLDDVPNIVENPDVRSIASSWRSAFDESRRDITLAGRPVAAVTFAINRAIGGQHIWGYRLVNLLIHAGAALGIYGIVRRTLLLPSMRDRFSANAALIAFAVALVWAVHPLNVTSVTYVIQRVESLAGLCILLTLYCFIRGSTGGSKLWLEAAVVACAVGMGVKETVVAAPLLVLIYDATFLSGSFGAALRRRGVVYAALAATWLIAAALVLASPRSGLIAHADWSARLDYLRIQCWAVPRYLVLALWPVNTIVDYGGPAVGELPRGGAIGCAVLLVLLAGTVFAIARRSWIGFLGAAFILILAPSSSIVPIPMEAAAEHRMYLPLAAVATVLVVALSRVAPAKVLVAVCVLAAVGLGGLTLRRNALFHDDLTLWSRDVALQPNNARSRNALGLAYFEDERFADAIEQYRGAIRTKPAYAEAWHNLGDALFRSRQLPDADRAYRRALELPPPSFKTHYNLGQLLLAQQRLPEAIEQLRRATELNPREPRVWNVLGFALARAGEYEPALESFRKALAIEPNFADARTNLQAVSAIARSRGASSAPAGAPASAPARVPASAPATDPAGSR